jgi:protein O-GlcNAc transferase
MDYLVTDPTCIPPELRSYYDEKLLILPHSYFVNDVKQTGRSVLENSRKSKRATYGIEEVKFMFS